MEYVNNVSLKLDIYIFFKTIKCVLKGEGFSNSKSAIHEELRVLEKQHESKKKDNAIRIIYKPNRKNKNIVVNGIIPELEDTYNSDSTMLVQS